MIPSGARQVCVFEEGRIFQPEPQRAIDGDVGEPDQPNRQVQALRLESEPSGAEQHREDQVMGQVVGDAPPFGACEIEGDREVRDQPEATL
jgi:hypothetical protein